MRIGRAQRPLMAFVMVLSYSRMMFLRFYLAAAMGCVHPWPCRCASRRWGSRASCSTTTSRVQCSSALAMPSGSTRACSNSRPTTTSSRGRWRWRGATRRAPVERSIRYVRENFFAARTYRDLDDLNAQANAWCAGQAADRPCPEQGIGSVREVWLDEQPRLLALPENPFPSEQRLEVAIHKTPYARFDAQRLQRAAHLRAAQPHRVGRRPHGSHPRWSRSGRHPRALLRRRRPDRDRRTP